MKISNPGDTPLSYVESKGQQRASGVAIPLESSSDAVDLTLKDSNEAIVEHESDEEESSGFTPMQRRRKHNERAVSESESDDDVPVSRKRLQRVGDIEDNEVSGKCSPEKSENLNDDELEDEMEGDDSSNEDGSLNGFIAEDSLSGDCSDESESDSEGSVGYRDVIAALGSRRKGKLMKWEYESDMLADFGKSEELCMKAICVLYRQQTSEEKSCKETIQRNGRGFSQMHASRGTFLAEFLTDGDPHGDMNKTVEELRDLDSEGVEQCQKLANHYSKQLFEIYKNEEDPFFHPLQM